MSACLWFSQKNKPLRPRWASLDVAQADVAPGFTLIEIAVVIAILGILAAAAIVRQVDASYQAELTTIQDFKTKLNSAASLYLVSTGQHPRGFSDFVSNTNPPSGQYTIAAVFPGLSACGAPQSAEIRCPNFRFWQVTYTWNGEYAMGRAEPKAGNPQPSVTF
jgi:prepilin-type N-terminal cleavage/methylation domain-containing protein